MRRFVEVAGQSALFPECLEDWIGEDNPVRVIDVFADELDLAELGFSGVDPEVTGRPSLQPAARLNPVEIAVDVDEMQRLAAMEKHHLADRRPIVLAEIGNRFVIRDQSAEKPDHLEIATGLTLQPPARLHPIEIAVDVELEQGRGMIRGPARYFRHNAFEPELAQIKRIDERIDRANRLLSSIHSSRHSGNKVDCPRSAPTKKRFIDFPPPKNREENHNIQDVFTQPGSFASLRRAARLRRMSAMPLSAQPVDATQALNLSAGVSNCKVSRGRSFS